MSITTNTTTNGIFPTYPSGTGFGGTVLTSTGTGAAWVTDSNWYTTNYQVELMKRLDKIEERLLILEPAFELHEKYPALKEAYENYKLIEKLVNSQKDE